MLSVSLLLSLYGAGLAEPHSQLRSMLREVLQDTNSEARPQGGSFSVRTAFLGGDYCATRVDASSFWRLRSFIASLTSRLASLCHRGIVEGGAAVDGECGGLWVFHEADVRDVAAVCCAPPAPYDIVCKSQCEVCPSRGVLFFDVVPSRAGPLSVLLS